jgi:hypothetical protein
VILKQSSVAGAGEPGRVIGGRGGATQQFDERLLREAIDPFKHRRRDLGQPVLAGR